MKSSAENNSAHLFSANLTGAFVHAFGLPALGQPVSHIQNQVTVFVLKVDASRCAAVKAGLSRMSAPDVSIHHPDCAFVSQRPLSICVFPLTLTLSSLF